MEQKVIESLKNLLQEEEAVKRLIVLLSIANVPSVTKIGKFRDTLIEFKRYNK